MDFTPPPVHEINATPPPSFRLFDGNAIGIATFLGSVFAGACLVAVNEFKLQRPGRGVFILIAGFIFTSLYMVFAMNAPDSLGFAFNALNIGIAIGAWKATDHVYAQEFEAHRAAGGEVGLRGWAGCFGVIMLVLVAGVIVVVLMGKAGLEELAFEPDRTCIAYQQGEEQVCYGEQVSEVQAQCVVDYMAATQNFTGQGEWDLYLDREEDRTLVLSMIVNPDVVQQPEVAQAFTLIFDELKGQCMTGETFRLDMKDPNYQVVRVIQ